MKKILIALLTTALFFMPLKVSAAPDYEQQINQLAEDYNISVDNLMDLSLEDIVRYIAQQIENTAKQPLQLFVKTVAIILLFAVIKAVETEKNTTASNIIDNVFTLIVFINLLNPVKTIIEIIISDLQSLKNFMTVFLPVFAGISMSSGEFFTSTIYSGFFLTSLVFISDFLLNYIIPSLQVYFSLIISDTLSPFIRLKSISDFYVKAVRWIMKSIVSVICFVLTLQTTISQGKDTLTVKAGKFITSVAVPVIGSALQDAVGSVYASMEAIKGFAGAVGIAGIALIFLPSLITLAVYWVCTNCLYITGDLFELKAVSGCIKGFITVIELVISIVLLYMVMLLFSITIMISVTNGV